MSVRRGFRAGSISKDSPGAFGPVAGIDRAIHILKRDDTFDRIYGKYVKQVR